MVHSVRKFFNGPHPSIAVQHSEATIDAAPRDLQFHGPHPSATRSRTRRYKYLGGADDPIVELVSGQGDSRHGSRGMLVARLLSNCLMLAWVEDFTHDTEAPAVVLFQSRQELSLDYLHALQQP